MKILSIDGGGVLGCGPLEFLVAMEQSGVVFKEDVIAGTSVGGLITALRLRGHSWKEVSDIFDKWVGVIFKKPGFAWRMNPSTPAFPSDGIEQAVRAELGDLRCCDVGVPFFIPVFDYLLGRPKVYTNEDQALLSDVVLQTTAAPTYFAPRENRYADGGLVANNPSTLAVVGVVRKLGITLGELDVLSLNTGGTFWKPHRVTSRMMKVAWVKPLLEATLNGNEEIAEFETEALVRSHLRVTPRLAMQYPIDEPGVCAGYRAVWRGTFDDTRKALTKFIEASN